MDTELKGTAALQENLQEVLRDKGIKTSRLNAWNIFKDFVAMAVITTLEEEDMRLPLSGVGTFEISVRPLRQTHFSKSEDGKPRGKAITHNSSASFSFKPSSRITRFLEQNIEGVLKDEPNPEDLVYLVSTNAPVPDFSESVEVSKEDAVAPAEVYEPVAVDTDDIVDSLDDF